MTHVDEGELRAYEYLKEHYFSAAPFSDWKVSEYLGLVHSSEDFLLILPGKTTPLRVELKSSRGVCHAAGGVNFEGARAGAGKSRVPFWNCARHSDVMLFFKKELKKSTPRLFVVKLRGQLGEAERKILTQKQIKNVFQLKQFEIKNAEQLAAALACAYHDLPLERHVNEVPEELRPRSAQLSAPQQRIRKNMQKRNSKYKER